MIKYNSARHCTKCLVLPFYPELAEEMEADKFNKVVAYLAKSLK